MKILVACEHSGVVRDAFLRLGHDAYSCDVLESETLPSQHFECDVKFVINYKWDLMIAHPPCTYLCSSGLHWNKRREGRTEKTEEALRFVRFLMAADIPRIAIENPQGCIGTRIKPASQYIHPYQFGHDASKKTGLWLKNLPLLQPTGYVKPRMFCPECKKCSDYDSAFTRGCPHCGAESGLLLPRWSNQTDSGQNKLSPSANRWKERSRTYQGIANAMAEQWGNL